MKMLMSVAVLAAISLPVHAADDAAALELAKKSGCLACHSIDRKLVGPAWRDVGKKYAGVADAEAQIVANVRMGSKGTWGPVPMPRNVTIKDADVQTLVQYVLSLK